MLENLETINWNALNQPEMPQWIRNLTSKNEKIRDEAFDDIRDSYIHERPDLAKHVVPFVVEILSDQNTVADVALLLHFMYTLRINAIYFIQRNSAVEESLNVIKSVDSGIDIYRVLATNEDDEIREEANSLLNYIDFANLSTAIIGDLSNALFQVSHHQTTMLTSAILNAERIFVAGKGRTGLQMRAFAMRLMHLGLTMYVVDDVTTPAIQAGDLLIIGSGSGRTASLVRYTERSTEIGATLATITGNIDSPIADNASIVVHIPASNFKSGKAEATQFTLIMGSLFEHTLGLLCDLMTIQLKAQLDVGEDDMNKRHANLE